MLKVELLHKREEADRMHIYVYEVHSWLSDAKFWLVGDKWCTDLDGKNVVGELRDYEVELIRKYTPVIEQHEKENQNWLAFQKCRKRTCICKSCVKFCNCSSCKGKINDCDKKQLNT